MTIKKNMDRLKRTQRVVKLLLVTAEYHVIGDLRLPISSVVEEPTNENLLFYALNCGNMFIALENCTIMRKDAVEYLPEHVKNYNINLNIVQSCKIITD